MDCMLYRLGRSNETVFKVIKKECYGSYFPPEDKEYRNNNQLDDEEIDELIKREEEYKEVCDEKDTQRTEKFLRHNELKCLNDRIQSPIGLKVLSYCWKRFYGKKNLSFPSGERDWLSFACPVDGEKILRTGKEVVTCFENLISPGPSFSYDSDSQVSSDEEKTLGRCHRDAIDLDAAKK